MGGLEVAVTPGATRAGADTTARPWRSRGVVALAGMAAVLLGVFALHGGVLPHGPRLLGGSGAGNQTLSSPSLSAPLLEGPPLAPGGASPAGTDDATAAPALALRGNVRARRDAGKEGVEVTIGGLSCLKPDFSGEDPDPYVECRRWGKVVFTSTTKDDTQTPKWDETFFVSLSLDQTATIHCQIWDDDYGLDDRMGTFSISLKGGKPQPDGRVQTTRPCVPFIVAPAEGGKYPCGSDGNLPWMMCFKPRLSIMTYQVAASSR